MTDTEQPGRPHLWWRQFVPRRFPRSYVPRASRAKEPTLLLRSIRWLLPWEMQDYPGIYRGAVEVLGGLLTKETLRTYIKRRKPVSEAVARALHRAISVRMEAGAALLHELEQAIADGDERRRRKREAGLMRVDPVTGLSGRQKAGKRRGVKTL
jgi:hypothetical protein